MYKQQKINIEMVINALMSSASVSAGISAADIMALTGLSSSTVYRIIARHPAIQSMNVPGRKQLYYLDHDILSSVKPPVGSKRKRRVDLSADLISAWEHASKINVNKLQNEYLSGIRAEDASQVKLMKLLMAVGAVSKSDSPTPEQIDAARSAIRELVTFTGAMHIIYSNMLRHPKFKSDDEFKNTYPKEQ